MVSERGPLVSPRAFSRALTSRLSVTSEITTRETYVKDWMTSTHDTNTVSRCTRYITVAFYYGQWLFSEGNNYLPTPVETGDGNLGRVAVLTCIIHSFFSPRLPATSWTIILSTTRTIFVFFVQGLAPLLRCKLSGIRGERMEYNRRGCNQEDEEQGNLVTVKEEV